MDLLVTRPCRSGRALRPLQAGLDGGASHLWRLDVHDTEAFREVDSIVQLSETSERLQQLGSARSSHAYAVAATPT